MAYLIAALAATAAGPLLYKVLHERPGLARVVDGFVYAAVPLLVAWQIVPLAWDRRSALPLLALGAGLLAPMAFARASQPLRQGTETVTLLVVLSGLLLHTLFDGAALAPLASGQSAAAAFGLAVVLHRLLEGLVVWWILRPGRGVAAAAGGIAAVLVTTAAGFALGRELLGGNRDAGTAAVELYQALVAGSLLHVIFHEGRLAHAHTHDH